jgi:hypothetical protein
MFAARTAFTHSVDGIFGTPGPNLLIVKNGRRVESKLLPGRVAGCKKDIAAYQCRAIRKNKQSFFFWKLLDLAGQDLTWLDRRVVR